MHDRERIKLNETIKEEWANFRDEKIQRVREQLKRSGYMILSQVWTEPWNPRHDITEQETKQIEQRHHTHATKHFQLENECEWEMKNLDKNYEGKVQELEEDITMQRQMIQNQRNQKEEKKQMTTTKTQQARK